jgi:AraC-like DNA-binding protein/mannose-6-phosphate isomerase-like protein (cupin superfamily)
MPKIVGILPHSNSPPMSRNPPSRSTDPRDYQRVARPFAAMAKSFTDGFEIEPHHHRRDQLIYAVSGLMRVRTRDEAWIVPPDRAVYVPARTTHAISMRGAVEMRTLYIEHGMAFSGESLPPTRSGVGTGSPQKARPSKDRAPESPTVLAVSDLLRELILALIDEPLLYDAAGRGGAIVALIMSEIARAPRLPLVIPMPKDARLARVCEALLDDPADRRTLEGWSQIAGASARTLDRLFESELHLSFTAWRQRVRFHNALEAIAQRQPVARIAAENGYRSPSAFSAAFRRLMGHAPTARAQA